MKKETIVVERVLDAPVGFVWSILTQPDYILIWFGSDLNGKGLSAEVDFKVGGKYRICFSDSDGSIHTAFGEYIEIEDFQKLRFSFEWLSEPGFISEVLVELLPNREKTLLVLTHSNLNPDSAHGYFDGWNGTIDKIERRIISE